MGERWRSIFEAVRAACSPGVWSRGVELSRAKAVHCERVNADEALFRIALRGGMMSRAVTLFLDDDDWDCECGSEQHGCEHAAAAVIAWRRHEETGEAELEFELPCQYDPDAKHWLFNEPIGWGEVFERWKGRGPMNEEYVESVRRSRYDVERLLAAF